MPPYSYRDMVREAEASLIAHGKEPRIAVLLLEDLLAMDTTSRLVNGHLEVPDAARELYQRALERVEQGEPYQYVSGVAWFYGEAFKVNAHTLIPRNETEELVALVLEKEKDDGRTIVDIGSGTGAIGITLGKVWKKNEVILTDLSVEALHVAAENAKRHGVSPQMLSGDLFVPLIEGDIKVDAIVSNPPYISRSEQRYMDDSVILHEPELALYAEEAGLGLYKKMIRQLANVLKQGGRVYFEIGWKQAEALSRYVTECWPGTQPEILKDINGNDRILHFRWEG
ncbi:peptide chain release factor N(5)-glutamine methyltransferase [Salinicoccus jeotgali]|uniref:peptide chain release factor N(5)-glutamine methyltransferase n=1 Tax=Salinicoccus jeotgali TaxID=381634 RepID=A0ABP7E886_9STAP